MYENGVFYWVYFPCPVTLHPSKEAKITTDCKTLAEFLHDKLGGRIVEQRT